MNKDERKGLFTLTRSDGTPSTTKFFSFLLIVGGILMVIASEASITLNFAEAILLEDGSEEITTLPQTFTFGNIQESGVWLSSLGAFLWLMKDKSAELLEIFKNRYGVQND